VPQVIDGIYEIERELGAGGGGVVYLAKHLRLDKQVVMKGDKRSLTARQETLRREVDSLKNLSHQYIPQVYDYVSDGEIVYTVMDFIEGESFNKSLGRGERFEQARIVKWAGQLLEAVAYLHKQPPHGILHADIKPANIMLTPQDDIMLIDFNIALMLGEEGAIAVGRSFGYASPEHYGVDYSTGATTRGSSVHDGETRMLTEGDAETILDGAPEKLPSSGSGGMKLLDVRSDIYSIGATLFHLLTGVRPSRGGMDLIQSLQQSCSLALADIVEKAMSLNPDQRYQTAEEMLNAIRHLRENDPRVLRWKRARTVACVVLAAAFVLGATSAFVGNRQAEQQRREQTELLLTIAKWEREQEEVWRIAAERQSKYDSARREEEEELRIEAQRLHRIEEMRVLAAASADALRAGDRMGAIKAALAAVPAEDGTEADVPYLAEAQKALADALGVYDLSDGYKPHLTVTLPSHNSDLAISPGGESFAAMSLGRLSVFGTSNGAMLADLPAIDSGLADVRYIDEDTLVYAAPGGLVVYDLLSGAALWTGSEATGIALSADGRTIAAVNRDEAFATIYGADGAILAEIDFGGRRPWTPDNDRFGDFGGNIFALSHDGALLAASFANGGLELFSTKDTSGNSDIEIFDESEFTFFEGGFHGKYFAFSATGPTESMFAVVDTERLKMNFSTTLPGRIGAYADEGGVYMSYNGIHVMVDPETARQTPIDGDPRDRVAGGYRVEGSMDSPIVQVSKKQSHGEKAFFAYDLGYVHDEARLNVKGDRMMLFQLGGFRVYDLDGSLVNETRIPDAGKVHDQQYRRDGGESFLEVLYRDGRLLKYSGDDGALVATESVPAPDPTLYEEFYAGGLLIKSPLDGAPTAHNAKTGELIRELDRDAHLTYVTQAGVFVIVEYIAMSGERFGLLLDGETCETLAYIPGLCDVIGERLIIDDRTSGTLREIRAFHADELVEMAREVVM